MPNVKSKKEMNLMSNQEFFAKIAEKCNYISEELVKDVYYELVRLTSNELRHNGAIRYPDLGDFYIKYRKEKVVRNVSDGKLIKMPPQKVVKFTASHKIQKYFASLS